MRTNTDITITTDDLHAYVDGQLPRERVGMVEAYLLSNREAAAEVADYRQIKIAFHQAYDDVLDEPVRSTQVSAVRHYRARWAVPMAAAIAALIIGTGLGWYSHGFVRADRSVYDELAERSSAAYVVYAPETWRPVEVAATEAAQLSSWFSKRMATSFRIPKLSDLGFKLVGGRLMVGKTAPAALLMYENREGRRVVLYFRNDLATVKSTKMRYVRKIETGVVIWVDGKMGFALAGGFPENKLMPAAQLVRAQLSS